MKRIIGACMVLALVLSVAWAGSAQAIQARSGERPEIASNEIIDSSAYLAGSRVTVEGTVKGDLFCAGQEVTISGVVEGDVLCAGQNVRVSGEVQGDLRIASQFALVSGAVDGSASIFAQTANVEDKTSVGKDLTVFAQTATVQGAVGRDILAGGETLSLGAKIQRDAQLLSDDIVLRNATINGNLAYVSYNQAKLEQNTVVAGKTERQDPPAKHESDRKKSEVFFAGPVFWLGSFLLIGIILLAALAKFAEKQAAESQQKPFFTLGVGLLMLVVTPMIAVFSLITVVGLPLAFILFALWLSAMIISVPLASYTFGRFMTQKLGWTMRGLRYISLFIGLLVFILLSMIPFVGGLVVLVAMLWGLGSLALGLYRLPAPAETKRKVSTKA